MNGALKLVAAVLAGTLAFPAFAWASEAVPPEGPTLVTVMGPGECPAPQCPPQQVPEQSNDPMPKTGDTALIPFTAAATLLVAGAIGAMATRRRGRRE